MFFYGALLFDFRPVWVELRTLISLNCSPVLARSFRAVHVDACAGVSARVVGKLWLLAGAGCHCLCVVWRSSPPLGVCVFDGCVNRGLSPVWCVCLTQAFAVPNSPPRECPC